MARLTHDQRSAFWRNGWLYVPDAIDRDLLKDVQRDFARWVEESRSHPRSYGTTSDGQPRFEVEPGHSAERPALRRVRSPVEISEPCRRLMADSAMPDLVAELIGPGIRFHHSKINARQAGSVAAGNWHQDFAFMPHSNDDVVSAMLFLDPLDDDNGPLELVSGSHKGDIHSHWQDGHFAAAVDPELARDCDKKAVRCTGPAGGICLMHSRLLHASPPNRLPRRRTIFVAVYSAEDAVPLAPNPFPSRFARQVVRGHSSNRVRTVAFEMELPQPPAEAGPIAARA